MARLLVILILSTQNLRADPIPRQFDPHRTAFLCTRLNETNFQPIGTCSFITMPYKNDRETVHGYILTAKHVLYNEDGKLPHELWVRLTRRDGGGIGYSRINFDTNLVHVLTHSDKAVDIAAIYGSLPLEKVFMVNSTPLDHVVTREGMKSLSIREGDEMFFLGLFTPFYGANENLPVFRFGRLALVTKEKIATREGPAEFFLMEAQVFPGNSGSPAFFYFSPQRAPGDTYYLLAGVVKGYFPNLAEVQTIEAKTTNVVPLNTGIGLVTPGYYIHEILESEDAQKYRDVYDAPMQTK